MFLGVLWMTFALAQDAADVSTSFSNDFEMRYWMLDKRLSDPADVPVFNYLEQVNRFNASATSGRWTLEFQVDQVALFANQYYLDDVLYTENQLLSPEVSSPFPDFSYANPEKLRVRYDADDYSLTIGDAYVAFGRGLALNMNRNVDIDLDSSVQGVKGVFRPGAWDITMVAGQANRQQVFQDNPNLLLQPDYRHTLGGLRLERFGLGPANIGAHSVVYTFAEDKGLTEGFPSSDNGVDAVVSGATAEFMGVAGIDWFVEGDVFQYPSRDLVATLDPKDQDKPGYGMYGSMAFYPGRTVWLVEGKRYKNTELLNSALGRELYEVSVAPTLEYERAINEDTSATVNSNDVWGARVRMDWSAKPGELVPYWSVAVYRDLELGTLHFNRKPETIIHPVIGVEFIQDRSAALVNVGYRVDDRDGSNLGQDEQFFGDAALKFPMPGAFQGELQTALEFYQWGANAFQQTDYAEMENSLTINYGPDVAFIFYNDYSNNPLVVSTGNLTDTLYGAFELQVKPTSSLTMKAFYGAYKAGIRCAGGQCRQLPGFEGGRVSMVGTF